MGTTTFQSLVKASDSTQKWGYKWFGVNDFNLNVEGSAQTSQTLMAMGQTAEGTTVEVENANAKSQVGLKMATGEVAYTNMLAVPDDMDVAASSYLDVYYTASAGTTTQTHTFTVKYKEFDFDDDATNAATTTFAALDTVIAGDAEADTAYVVVKTPQGIMNASSLAAAGNLLQFELTATTIQTSTVYVFGMQWKYAKRYM